MEVTGAAQELLLAVTARQRHQARVEQVLALSEDLLRVYVHAVLDDLGVGGTRGLEGAGTTRIGLFRSLGKGRKHANDGAAWTAAIQQAARVAAQRLFGEGSDLPLFGVGDGAGAPVLYVKGPLEAHVWTFVEPEGHPSCVPSDTRVVTAPVEWLRVLAARALLAVTGARSLESSLFGIEPAEETGPDWWAALYNHYDALHNAPTPQGP